MVVGAVVNKPNHQSSTTSSQQQYGISVNPAAVMAGNQPSTQSHSMGLQVSEYGESAYLTGLQLAWLF